MSYEIALDQLDNKMTVLDQLFLGDENFNDGTFNSVRKLVKENCNKMTKYLSTENYKSLEVVSDNSIVYMSKVDENKGNDTNNSDFWIKIGNLNIEHVTRVSKLIQFNKDLSLNFGSEFVHPIEKIETGIYRITFIHPIVGDYSIITNRENLDTLKDKKVNELIRTKTSEYFEIESYDLGDDSLFDSDKISIMIFEGD